MAIAAAEPAPAAVITWARGSTTLPAAQTPSVLVRPVASTVTKPACVDARSPVRPAGHRHEGRCAGRMNTAVRSITSTVGQLDAGQPVVLDHQPRDLAADDPHAARLQLELVRPRSGRRCGRRRPRRRTTAERAVRAGRSRPRCRGRRGAGRGPPTRGSTGSAGDPAPTARGRPGISGSSSRTPVATRTRRAFNTRPPARRTTNPASIPTT